VVVITFRTEAAARGLANPKEDDVKQKLFIVLWVVLVAAACGQKKEDVETEARKAAPIKRAEPEVAEKTGVASTAIPDSKRRLIVTQSEFKPNDKGLFTVPDKGVMLLLKRSGGAWVEDRIEDTDSNVLHKGLPYGKDGILTIGAEKAMLKLWKKSGDKWQSETLWNPVFGGKFNRLRDMELADFNGDGTEDVAIATHDQGVIAVVWRKGEKWEAEELDRTENMFVHEIEVGDLDKDGQLEIYATPSQPNTVSGKDQGGKVVRFSWNGTKFDKSEVISFESRHVKEILVSDVDGDGSDELYAAVEAEVDGPTIKAPVEIRRFDLKGKKFEETLVAKIDDRFCRFLVAGDIDHDGKNELIASAFSAGVWVIEKTDGGYEKSCIDSESGGFEHASYLADLEGDGTKELYVADDKAGVIRRYAFKDGSYEKDILTRRQVASQAMVWNITDGEI
jgi:hypothetical protein